jgi:deoxyhypusine synthase
MAKEAPLLPPLTEQSLSPLSPPSLTRVDSAAAAIAAAAKQEKACATASATAKTRELGPVGSFIKHHYRHFNAAVVVDAAEGFQAFLDRDGKMMITLAGAMSTAELGLSLAEMIRRDKIHLISCTGANLEEDIYNLVAHDFYERVPNYRDLTPQDEVKLLARGMNRVTDTCIPEEEAMRRIERVVLKFWMEADQSGKRYFPHEFFWQALASGALEKYYQVDPKNSWMLAALEKNVPIIVPGWEDSTMGNIYTAAVLRGDVKNVHTVRTGIEYMIWLAEFYRKTTAIHPLGMFQIGGGIAGDFPICVVPMIRQDMRIDVPLWAYFCQISDSTTSYGSYSGAIPNEKITWGKLGVDTPKFIIESDASIVAPLIFAYLLGW